MGGEPILNDPFTAGSDFMNLVETPTGQSRVFA
jgi:hypothetical protein